jgi:hypothetical protein
MLLYLVCGTLGGLGHPWHPETISPLILSLCCRSSLVSTFQTLSKTFDNASLLGQLFIFNHQTASVLIFLLAGPSIAEGNLGPSVESL